MQQYLFLSIQLINELPPFLFEHSNFCLIFFKFFFIPRSKNLLSIKVFCYIYPGPSIFNFFNHKNFFRSIWSATFCKNDFNFRYSDMVAYFKIRIPVIIFFTKANICARYFINKLHFDCTMISIVVFTNYII